MHCKKINNKILMMNLNLKQTIWFYSNFHWYMCLLVLYKWMLPLIIKIVSWTLFVEWITKILLYVYYMLWKLFFIFTHVYVLMCAGEMLRESQKGEHSKFIWKIVEKQLQSLVNNVMNHIRRIHKRVVFLKNCLIHSF